MATYHAYSEAECAGKYVDLASAVGILVWDYEYEYVGVSCSTG